MHSESEDNQCRICLMATNQPVRCKGPCQKYFCFKCAVKAIPASNHCPNRCSSPFVIQVPPQDNQNFRCTFNPQICNLPITTKSQMLSHPSICEFASPQDKHRYYQQQNFRCQCGDRLCFLDRKALLTLYKIENYVDTVKDACHKCHQDHLCRSLCISCSIKTQRKVVYCSQCMPIPCTRTKCPKGHTFKRRKRMSKWRFCDQCNAAAYMVGQYVYGYCPCDFDLCQRCQNQTKSENIIIPLPNMLEDLYSLATIQDNLGANI